MQVFGLRMGGQGMIIRHKEEAIVLVLHFYKILHRSKIIPQVKVPCRSDSAQYCIHPAKL